MGHTLGNDGTRKNVIPSSQSSLIPHFEWADLSSHCHVTCGGRGDKLDKPPDFPVSPRSITKNPPLKELKQPRGKNGDMGYDGLLSHWLVLSILIGDGISWGGGKFRFCFLCFFIKSHELSQLSTNDQ